MDTLPVFSPTPGGLLSLAVTFLLPLIVGVITKQSWGTGIKGTVLLFVAFLKTLLEAWLAGINAGVDVDLWALAYTTLVNFLIAVAAYFGLLRGTPLAEAAQRSGVTEGRHRRD